MHQNSRIPGMVEKHGVKMVIIDRYYHLMSLRFPAFNWRVVL